MNQKLNVLVVDPDQQEYQQIKSLFEDCYSFVVTSEWVSDVDDALRLMAENKHDVYLLTHGSAQHGLSLLEQSFAQGCLGPVVILGEDIEENEASLSLQSGAVEHLLKKSLDATLLTGCVQNALTRKRLQDVVRETQNLWIDYYEQTQSQLSRRLHEGPLQDLIGMRLYLGFATDSIENPDAKQHLAFVQQTLQGVIDSLRSFCVELRPPSLDPFGLSKAIRAEGGRFRTRYPDLNLTLDLDESDVRLPEQARISLYRVFQKALSNIIEHAHATDAYIRYQVAGNKAHLEISDNGEGFVVPDNWIEFARNNRFGLFEAAQQVLHVGGTFCVESNNKAMGNGTSGTTVKVEIPLA